MEDPIGGTWLAREYRLELTQPLATVSAIGGRRTTHSTPDGRTQETYVEAMRPAASLRGHLAFHLKHEVPSLQLLARLFAVCDPRELQAWIDGEPTGQYARRACFLFEWLTESRPSSMAASRSRESFFFLSARRLVFKPRVRLYD